MSDAGPGIWLAIETAARIGSVAIGASNDAGGVRMIAGRQLQSAQRYTTELLPSIRDLLSEHGSKPADIAVVCWSRGPGSFTGLRVGATVAAMLRSATGCHVIGVPTPAAMALRALRDCGARGVEAPSLIVPLMNLRGGRFVAGIYERSADLVRERVAPLMVELNSWLDSLSAPVLFTGEGCEKSPELSRWGQVAPPSAWHATAAEVLAVAADRAASGRFDDPGDITPLYLRPPECEEVYEARRAAARARRGE
ncbi:MAG: tRNA (adenosine(37)-N6)-threonylcarbamoyltransferase complex dimerization subunit type 1 TsaB [Phycisphaerales bacterium]|nr:tRNA (adenosine(37)-N6)-threonylcarbamoyltransferase complex dimerization subunit type 1 TsaB [Phycisphaerales bacterium]